MQPQRMKKNKNGDCEEYESRFTLLKFARIRNKLMKPQRKSMRKLGYRIGFVLVIVFIGITAGSHTIGANFNNKQNAESQVITVPVGESTIVKALWPTVRVAVTDPKIADVKILTPDQVLLQGNKLGSTDLILWGNNDDKVWHRKVQVTIDLERFKSRLDEMFPNSTLEVSQSGEVLVIKGLLRKAEQAAQLHDFLNKLQITYSDMTSVAGVQQVQLDVRVAEVSRRALRLLSINSLYASNSFFGGVTVAPSSGTPLLSGIDIGTTSLEGSFSSSVTIFGGGEHFATFLQALSENQYLRILANPTLVALSGEEANFLAGGEYPIPVVQGVGGGTGGTSITIEYKEYGVRLSFRPVVLGDGTIRLYAAPEISDISSVGAVTIQGFQVPSLITRKAETTLELKSGQTFAMAGLLKRDVAATVARIPGLGDLPILGALFRSVRYQQGDTELVILVTASLVEPMSIARTPPLPGFLHVVPDDWEVYIDGRIEGKTPSKICPADAEWLKQRGLDNLVGPGAWDSYDKPAPPSQADMTSDTTGGAKEFTSAVKEK